MARRYSYEIKKKGRKIIDFLVEYIIYRYGIPSKLFMDIHPSFRGNEVKEV